MYIIKLENLQGNNATKPIKNITDTAGQLSKIGTRADYEKEFGKMPVTKLVRQLVGLDRTAANELFSQFLNNQTLNSKQIHFVKLIVDYVVKNGLIDDNKILQQEPFRNLGSIVELFKENMDEARNIMGVIADIKKNAEVIV